MEIIPLFNGINSKLKESPILHRLIRGAFWSLMGTAALRILSLVTTIFIARILGKENFGAYGMIESTLGMFGLFAGLAMGSTMTKYLAELRVKDSQKASRILSLATTLSIFTSGLVMLIVILSAPSLTKSMLKRGDLAGILGTGAVWLFVSTLNNVQTGALAGFEGFKEIARVNLIQAVLTPVLSIPLVYFLGIQGGIIALIMDSSIGYWMCNIAVKRECRRYGIVRKYFDLGSFGEWPILWKFSIPAIMSGILVMPVTWITNAILVNQQNGYGELGLFNAANQWRQLILFVPQILGTVMLPIFSEINGHNSKGDFTDALSLNLRLTWTIALPATILIIILREPISSLFGKQYAGIAPMITVLMISSFLYVINGVIGTALAGTGRMWVGMAFNVAWAVTLIAATLILVPVFGGMGLAFAYLISYFLHTVWQMTYTELKLAPSSITGQRELASLSIITLGLICISEYYVHSYSILNVALMVVALIPLYRFGAQTMRKGFKVP